MNLYKIINEEKDPFYVIADSFGTAYDAYKDNFTSAMRPKVIKLIEEDVTIQEEKS